MVVGVTLNPDHLRRDTARTVAAHVRADVERRLVEIGDGSGCEASAARAFEAGRLAVVDGDMWDALGLARPVPPAVAP